eukprot:TRINITY_DN869_c0_g1_i1.p1 TRINITY_DN869_c0_g1~~TRINITY_DN869_c0_g1_i1.p1  ORF type:complete len:524 (-),score=98.97 TRINITY_DN869_c0_g1_i1:93-1664(-)
MSSVQALSAQASELMTTLRQPSNNTLIFIVLTILCCIVPLDLTQLIFAVLGAFCYYLVQMLQRSVSTQQRMNKNLKSAPTPYVERRRPPRSQDANFREARKRPELKRPIAMSKPGVPMDTQAQSPVVPVVAPTFQGVGVEAEVQELLSQIMPTAESQRGVDRLAEAIRVMLVSTLPEVEVLGFASSNLARGRANGVAVPDVDIVINVSPDHVCAKFADRTSKVRRVHSEVHAKTCEGHPQTEPRMLQKWALRSCADKLVSAGGFKFRRSGFRGQEPKMTLLVPMELGIFNQAVAIDISVNSVSPLHSAALLTECGTINPRAKELILLVRRWAKDRGVVHAPKGHLPPYVWSLLAIYFLQVRKRGSLLPPLSEFEATSNLLGSAKRQVKEKKWTPKEGSESVCTAELLQDFMCFFGKEFDWKKEAICVRRGVRGPAPLNVPIHIIEHEDGRTMEAGPTIEDPFSPSQNLASSMTWWSFQRMKEELLRASDLLSDGSKSLTMLLEPWTPDANSGGSGPKAEGEEL